MAPAKLSIRVEMFAERTPHVELGAAGQEPHR